MILHVDNGTLPEVQGDPQSRIRRTLGPPLAAAVALVAPFVLLEYINAPASDEGLPWVLFGFMFGHALLIALAVTPAARRVLELRSVRALSLVHWLCLAGAVVLIGAYGSVLHDQWPCFLGVPNCD